MFYWDNLKIYKRKRSHTKNIEKPNHNFFFWCSKDFPPSLKPKTDSNAQYVKCVKPKLSAYHISYESMTLPQHI